MRGLAAGLGAKAVAKETQCGQMEIIDDEDDNEDDSAAEAAESFSKPGQDLGHAEVTVVGARHAAAAAAPISSRCTHGYAATLETATSAQPLARAPCSSPDPSFD